MGCEFSAKLLNKLTAKLGKTEPHSFGGDWDVNIWDIWVLTYIYTYYYYCYYYYVFIYIYKYDNKWRPSTTDCGLGQDWGNKPKRMNNHLPDVVLYHIYIYVHIYIYI